MAQRHQYTQGERWNRRPRAVVQRAPASPQPHTTRQERPWILYEAGVAKGKLNTAVYGIALGIPLNRANSGPFAQFQNCGDGEDELTKLVRQLVQRVPGSDPDTDALQMQVRMFKERIDKALKNMTTSKKTDELQPAETSVAKLFEEVKVMFQDLPSRIERRGVEPSQVRRLRHFHPMMLEEMWDIIGTSPDDPIGLLVIASLFRDDLPWLYELGSEAYRIAKRGNADATEQAMFRFQRAVEFTVKGPIAPAMGMSKDLYMMLDVLLETMDRFRQRRFRPSKVPPPLPKLTKKPPTADSEAEGK